MKTIEVIIWKYITSFSWLLNLKIKVRVKTTWKYIASPNPTSCIVQVLYLIKGRHFLRYLDLSLRSCMLISFSIFLVSCIIAFEYLISRILSGTSFNANARKNAFGWSSTKARRTRYSENMNTVVFFLYKLWTYFNQTKNIKQIGIYSQNTHYNWLVHISLASFLRVFTQFSFFFFSYEYKLALTKFICHIC